MTAHSILAAAAVFILPAGAMWLEKAPALAASPVETATPAVSTDLSRHATDAEALSFVAAMDESAYLSAGVAFTKNLRPEVKVFAEALSTDHGNNLEKTLKLVRRINLPVMESDAVEQLRDRRAGELAELLGTGEDFDNAYITSALQGEAEALAWIDSQLALPGGNKGVKQHLHTTREQVVRHLAAGKALLQTASR